MEKTEVTLYRLLQGALRSGNSIQIKTARENYVAVNDNLRRFDLLVARESRISQEMIPRASVEKNVIAFITALRTTITQAVNTVSASFNAPADIAATLAPLLQEQILNALSVLGVADTAMRLPPWFIASEIGRMGDVFKDAAATVKARRDILWEILAVIVDESARERAKQLSQLTAPEPAAV